MMMVGSGGSFSTATFAAGLHESTSGQLARAATPLDVVSKAIQDAGLVCFSARGRNRDIITAFRVAATREMEPLSALVLDEHTSLGKLGTKFGYADVVCMAHRLFKDGFLAVASLVGSSMLLVRAYRAVFGRSERDLPEGVVELIQQVTSFARLNGSWPSRCPGCLFNRSRTLLAVRVGRREPESGTSLRRTRSCADVRVLLSSICFATHHRKQTCESQRLHAHRHPS